MRSALDEGFSRVHVRREGLDEAEQSGAILQESDDPVLDEALEIARRNTPPSTGAGLPLCDEGAADVIAITSPVVLTLTRHQQTEAVIPQGLLPIGMTDNLGQSLTIGPKPLLTALRLVIHNSHHPLLLEITGLSKAVSRRIPPGFVTQ